MYAVTKIDAAWEEVAYYGPFEDREEARAFAIDKAGEDPEGAFLYAVDEVDENGEVIDEA